MIRYSGIITVTNTDTEVERLMNTFTFVNPVYAILKQKNKHRWTSPVLKVYVDKDVYKAFPRGALQYCVPNTIEELNVFPLSDSFSLLPEITLRDYQIEAAKTISASDNGYARMPTSSGKTLTMINLAVKLQQKTLILMDKTTLVEQWVKEIEKFTGYKAGKIHSKTKHLIKDITVATYQSITEDIINQFSLVIIDEAHHAVAGKFKELLMTYKGKHLYGCTATDVRSDGIPISTIFGKKLYEIGESKLISEGTILKPTYYQVTTPFTVGYTDEMHPTEMYTILLDNKKRNIAISILAAHLYQNNRTILLLTQRIEHANVLSDMLTTLDVPNEIIFGAVKESRRQELISAVREKKLQCLIGSTVADEGLDIPSLDTIVLTCPSKFKGKMVQRVGRAVRTAENKTGAAIYDIADLDEGVFIGQFRNRWNAMKEYFGLTKFEKIELLNFQVDISIIDKAKAI